MRTTENTWLRLIFCRQNVLLNFTEAQDFTISTDRICTQITLCGVHLCEYLVYKLQWTYNLYSRNPFTLAVGCVAFCSAKQGSKFLQLLPILHFLSMCVVHSVV